MWRVTTCSEGRIGLSTLFGGVVVGYMANHLLPLRVGEFVRAQYLSARGEMSLATSLSTVFVERVLDVSCLGCLLVVGLLVGIRGLTPDAVKIVLTVLAIACIIVLFVTLFLPRLTRQEHECRRILKRLSSIVKAFLAPMRPLTRVKTIFLLFGLSILAWTSNYFAVLALVHRISGAHFQAALLLLLFINVGLLIPSSPGALGVMQVAFWMALTPFGVIKEDALALSFAYQGVLLFFTITVGFPYFLKANLSLETALKLRERGLHLVKVDRSTTHDYEAETAGDSQ